MQFQFSGAVPSATRVAAALSLLDPDVKVVQDDALGCVDIQSSVSSDEVLQVLGRLGHKASVVKDEVHVSGGSTCCGGCS